MFRPKHNRGSPGLRMQLDTSYLSNFDCHKHYAGLYYRAHNGIFNIQKMIIGRRRIIANEYIFVTFRFRLRNDSPCCIRQYSDPHLIAI